MNQDTAKPKNDQPNQNNSQAGGSGVKQQATEAIKKATNLLITVSMNPSIDQLAACIGLTLLLNKLDKHATAVFSGQVPSTLEFLQPEKTIEQTTDSLRDFIISLDRNKADKLRYKVEDNVVKIFITPYRTSITDQDLQFSQGDFNVDTVIALGVDQREHLDAAIVNHGRILHDAVVVSMSCGQNTSDVGSVNWHEDNASSLCEMIVSISESFQSGIMDNQMATAFLTGIVAQTERFRNEKTTPKVMTMSAQLMAAGANQQLIANELESKSEIPSNTAADVPHLDDQPAAVYQPHAEESTPPPALEGLKFDEPTNDLPAVAPLPTPPAETETAPVQAPVETMLPSVQLEDTMPKPDEDGSPFSNELPTLPPTPTPPPTDGEPHVDMYTPPVAGPVVEEPAEEIKIDPNGNMILAQPLDTPEPSATPPAPSAVGSMRVIQPLTLPPKEVEDNTPKTDLHTYLTEPAEQTPTSVFSEVENSMGDTPSGVDGGTSIPLLSHEHEPAAPPAEPTPPPAMPPAPGLDTFPLPAPVAPPSSEQPVPAPDLAAPPAPNLNTNDFVMPPPDEDIVSSINQANPDNQDTARRAVLDAINSTGYQPAVPSPISALNAQPISLDQPMPNVMPTPDSNNTPPPPAPPPFLPGNLPTATSHGLGELNLPVPNSFTTEPRNPFNLPPANG